MRIPKPILSERAQRQLLDEKAIEVIEDPSKATAAIWDIIGETHVGQKSLFEYSYEGWGQRVGRLDKVLHDEVGLKLNHAIARQLRQRIQVKTERREARRQARLAKVA